MSQYIVNATGTVHSIPDEWLREKLASGYRLATQDEIAGSFKTQGLSAKSVPKVADLEAAYQAYEDGIGANANILSTTIGPRPGDVDVRLTNPGDPGYVAGTDGMRAVPSRITVATLNESTRNPATEGVGEQDAHAYEPIVPQVAAVAVEQAVGAVNPEVAAMQRGLDNEVTNEPTATSGPAPLGADETGASVGK